MKRDLIGGMAADHRDADGVVAGLVVGRPIDRAALQKPEPYPISLEDRGSPRCRGTVPSSFFELPLEAQSEYLPLLNDWFVAEHAEEVAALHARLRVREGGGETENDA